MSMAIARKKTAQEPFNQAITRKEASVLLGIKLSRIIDIIANHPYLNFPSPLEAGKREHRYSKRAVLKWKAETPLDNVRWHQRETKKQREGIDPGDVRTFLKALDDTPERQLAHRRLRITARNRKPKRRAIVSIQAETFVKDTNHWRGLI